MSQAGSFENGTIAPNVETLTGNVGGAVSPDALFNINIVGAGGTVVTGNPLTNTLTITTAGGGLTWSREVGAAVPLVNNHGYINTNAGLTTFTLPVNAAVGDVIEIAGEGAGGWTIAQNALQSIIYNPLISTVGIGGSVSSSNRYDTIKIVCTVANTTWTTTANIGLLIVV